MDFTFTEDQESLRRLARKILVEQLDEKSRRAAEAEGYFHAKAWQELAAAGLIGAPLPEAVGGAGMGLIEACLVLSEAGRAAAPIPLWATWSASLPIARFGNEAQMEKWLGPVAHGGVLAAALGDSARLTGHFDGGALVISGELSAVVAAERAAAVLAPVRIGEGVALVVISRKDGWQKQIMTTGEPVFARSFAGARVEAAEILVGVDGGAAALAWTIDHAAVMLCAMETGVAAQQIAMISDHAIKRQQFGKPIALFQAVAQRASDAFIDLQAIDLSTWQAAWRLSEGLDAGREIATAKFWACEGGHRVAAAAQHLHAGIGFDKTYPLYRYFLLAKQIELTLGGAGTWLARLGDSLAASQGEVR